ncbi:MAG: sugar ABC transporter ATP-binding protein [Eubacteriales bacterium]|nr:sugar ABC transporter ATP-binding protein [Eubacteriales bacterium]
MSGQKLLEMNNITKYIYDSYGMPLRNTTIRILDEVDFNLDQGEVHILVGENGAGKSTLMRILGGEIPHDEGEILINGSQVIIHGPRNAQELGIGFIHQELNLCDNLTIAENIFIGKELRGRFMMKKKEMKAQAQVLLEEMGIHIDAATLVKNLSTAQKQIVEIAKVLSYDCRIIIMDEPTSSLTQKEIEILFRLIHQLRTKGISIIYISHRLEEFEHVGDRLSVLRDGRYIGTIPKEKFDTDTIVGMMVGRKLGSMYQNAHIPRGHPVLEVKNLQLEPDSAPITIHVNAGEVVGMGGLVGAGRTELAKSIFGYRKSYHGEIWYNGERINKAAPNTLVRKGMIYLTEDRKAEGLILEMNVSQNISLASLFKMFRTGLVRMGTENKLAEKSVDELSISCSTVSQLTNTLSGGNQQKVVLSKCMATEPRLLLLDEPTRGIDVGAKAEIYRMIDHLAIQGVAVLMISSDMPELIGMSDRIYVMRQGAVVGEITNKEEMLQENILSYTIGKENRERVSPV